MPLSAGVVQTFKYTYWQNSGSYNQSDHSINIQGWLTLLVSVLTLAALIFQAWTNHRQRVLMDRQANIMEGQLGAAIKSAEAAKEASDAATRASYADRAWLFVEDAKRTRIDRTPDEKGVFRFNVSFTIRNAGRTPAVLTDITFRTICAINLFKQPDPNNLGINGIEVEFGSWLTENNYQRRYPVSGPFGVRGASHVTIGGNSKTGIIESAGHFEDRIIAPTDGFDKMEPWQTVYCLIQIKYLDLYRIPRETSFYAIISPMAEAERPRDVDLEKTYNYWN